VESFWSSRSRCHTPPMRSAPIMTGPTARNLRRRAKLTHEEDVRRRGTSMTDNHRSGRVCQPVWVASAIAISDGRWWMVDPWPPGAPQRHTAEVQFNDRREARASSRSCWCRPRARPEWSPKRPGPKPAQPPVPSTLGAEALFQESGYVLEPCQRMLTKVPIERGEWRPRTSRMGCRKTSRPYCTG